MSNTHDGPTWIQDSNMGLWLDWRAPIKPPAAVDPVHVVIPYWSGSNLTGEQLLDIAVEAGGKKAAERDRKLGTIANRLADGRLHDIDGLPKDLPDMPTARFAISTTGAA